MSTPPPATKPPYRPKFWLSKLLEAMEEPQPFEKRIVAYFDILGWKAAVVDPAQRKRVELTAKILHAFAELFSENHLKDLQESIGKPDTSITAEAYKGLSNIRITMFSDCVVMSSPQKDAYALINFIGQFCRTIMKNGFLFRGGITVGDLVHSNRMVYGGALHEVVKFDREGAMPGIVCTQSFLNLISSVDNPRKVNATLKDPNKRTVLNVLAFPEIPDDDKKVEAMVLVINEITQVIGGFETGLQGVREMRAAKKWRFMLNAFTPMVEAGFH